VEFLFVADPIDEGDAPTNVARLMILALKRALEQAASEIHPRSK
jgi:hypothetical protein